MERQEKRSDIILSKIFKVEIQHDILLCLHLKTGRMHVRNQKYYIKTIKLK